MRLGVNQPSLGPFETHLGRPVTCIRHFVQTQTPPDSQWATAFNLSSAGYDVSVNFRTVNTWAAAAAGAEDARFATIATYLATFPAPGWITFESEPESKGQLSSDWRAMQRRAIGIMRPIAPNWRYTLCLQAFTWFTTTRNPDDWVDDGLGADRLAIDYYNARGASDGGSPWADPARNDRHPTDLLTSPTNAGYLCPIDYVVMKNLGPLAMFELGCAVEDPAVNPNGHVKRAAWLQQASDLWTPLADFDAVFYFENGPPNFPHWAIAGTSGLAVEPDSLGAFRKLSETVEPPPPSPDVPASTVWTIHRRSLFAAGV